MIKMEELLRTAVEKGAADLFLMSGMPFSYRTGGEILYDNEIMLPEKIDDLIKELYTMAENRDMTKIRMHGEDDFSVTVHNLARFRVNVFRLRGSLAAVIRVIHFELPDYKRLSIPDSVIRIADMKKGFVLVTGPAGSGKTTTLSCIIDRINKTKRVHVITLEDPVEYLHCHDKSVVTQREIITDTDSYVAGLRAALRQAPNVILVGEMRDEETMRTALTAAETGHLVISTLHTVGAANTINRVIDSFPPNQQHQVRMQLAMVMQAVISQQLIPALDGSLVPAFEIMFFNCAVRNLVREAKIHQLDSVIAVSQNEGMITMDMSLFRLYRAGKISREQALLYCSNREWMEKKRLF